MGEAKGGEKRNWPPYLTIPTTQDMCPTNRHSSKVRNRTWDSNDFCKILDHRSNLLTFTLDERSFVTRNKPIEKCIGKNVGMMPK